MAEKYCPTHAFNCDRHNHHHHSFQSPLFLFGFDRNAPVAGNRNLTDCLDSVALLRCSKTVFKIWIQMHIWETDSVVWYQMIIYYRHIFVNSFSVQEWYYHLYFRCEFSYKKPKKVIYIARRLSGRRIILVILKLWSSLIFGKGLVVLI